MGIAKNDGKTAKYSYYIETQKSKLVVNIELPGGGSINYPKVIPMQGYYSFRFEGERNGELIQKYRNNGEKEGKDEDYEELDKDKMTSIMLPKNLKKSIKFIQNLKFQIKLSD